MIPERLVRFQLRTVLLLLAIDHRGRGDARGDLDRAPRAHLDPDLALPRALRSNPAVEWLQRHGSATGPRPRSRYLLALGFLGAIGFLFVPTLVSQVNDFVNKLPDYAHDVTHGRGRLGFLETKYHLQERIGAVKDGGAKKVLGLSGRGASRSRRA